MRSKTGGGGNARPRTRPPAPTHLEPREKGLPGAPGRPPADSPEEGIDETGNRRPNSSVNAARGYRGPPKGSTRGVPPPHAPGPPPPRTRGAPLIEPPCQAHHSFISSIGPTHPEAARAALDRAPLRISVPFRRPRPRPHSGPCWHRPVVGTLVTPRSAPGPSAVDARGGRPQRRRGQRLPPPPPGALQPPSEDPRDSRGSRAPRRRVAA